MAKARAIVKRRKAVRNIRKITKTMQMIATAKFQKSLKRAVGAKPYTLKLRELVTELAASVGDVERIASDFMNQFTSGKLDSVHVAYMNFISTSTQRPEVLTLLPLAGVEQAVNRIMKEVAEGEAQAKAGALDARRSGAEASAAM